MFQEPFPVNKDSIKLMRKKVPHVISGRQERAGVLVAAALVSERNSCQRPGSGPVSSVQGPAGPPGSSQRPGKWMVNVTELHSDSVSSLFPRQQIPRRCSHVRVLEDER